MKPDSPRLDVKSYSNFNNKAINIIVLLFLLTFINTTSRAGDSSQNLVFSYMVGSQSLGEKTELENIKVEQNKQTGLFGFDIEVRGDSASVGISSSRFHNNWRSIEVDENSSGTYILTTVILELRKYGRIFKNYSYYIGLGYGISLFEDRFKTNEGENKYEIIPLLTYSGKLGLEWRNDSTAYFLEAQYLYPESATRGYDYEWSADYHYFTEIFAPRLMMGIRFLY